MSNSTNGSVVREFEQAFASYVGAKYGIAVANGTCSLHTALVALGVQPGDRVAVPPLTMASTTLAVLHASGIPEYCDVDGRAWLMRRPGLGYMMPVSLYGLWSGCEKSDLVEDAAQTLNQHRGAAFTSYSFQASKILSAGEGGMLVTNDEELAANARQFRDLGYPPNAREHMKRPDAIRHTMVGWNYRLSDLVARYLLDILPLADRALEQRRESAAAYRHAIQGCDWIIPQYVPEGWSHSYWTYAVACDTRARADQLQAEIVKQGGELCYRAWRITYQEPAFRHLAPDGTCPIAEDLQPRLLQLQTGGNNHHPERAAETLRNAIIAV